LVKSEHTKLAKANNIHRHIVASFKRKISKFAEISDEKYYKFLINVGSNSFLIRFKKLKNKKSLNYPTKAALDFNSQQLKFDLTPQTPIICLNAGYEIKDEITNHIEIYLCFPNGNSIDWAINLSNYSQNVSHAEEKQVSQAIFQKNTKQEIILKAQLPTINDQKKKRKKQKEA